MGLVTKRLEHVPHSDPPRVVIKSANPEYDSYERLIDEIRIVPLPRFRSRRYGMTAAKPFAVVSSEVAGSHHRRRCVRL